MYGHGLLLELVLAIEARFVLKAFEFVFVVPRGETGLVAQGSQGL